VISEFGHTDEPAGFKAAACIWLSTFVLLPDERVSGRHDQSDVLVDGPATG
jgi:hypothetical protein